MKRERRNKIPVLLAFAEPLNVALTYYYSDISPPLHHCTPPYNNLSSPKFANATKKAPSATALFIFLLKKSISHGINSSNSSG